jgi:hypothetical protein
MIFFNYIFYRSYINLYKTKYKGNAEPRSILFVSLLQIIMVGVCLMIFSKIINLPSFNVGRNRLLILIAPLTFLVWHFNEKYYGKFSKNSYEILRNRFDKSKYNKIIPFWLVFIFPFVLLFGVPFILSLFK